jgi:hypothetical protein
MQDTTAPAPGENETEVDIDPPKDRREEVAEIASHVYEVREGKEGTPVEDWLKAEAILARKEHAAAIEQPLVDHSTNATAPKTEAHPEADNEANT